MSRAIMAFIISILIVGSAVALMLTHTIAEAVGVGMMTTVLGYWIRDVQDRLPAISP